MIPLNQLIVDLKTHGTVTVDWKALANPHFSGWNGKARARKWAAKHGFLLIFIDSGDQEQAARTTKATFYRSILRQPTDS